MKWLLNLHFIAFKLNSKVMTSIFFDKKVMTSIFMRGLSSAVQMITDVIKEYELVMISRGMLGCWV